MSVPTHAPTPLALTLTLPGVPASAGIARVAVGAALRRHGMPRWLPVTRLVVTELVACAARSGRRDDLRIELRAEAVGLRVTTHDT
ncbi:hypothetical protein [Streptomyces sp. NPDC060194]|uniref:hypothetical protein n=1 Tax=Streptomyces sp. NPDC060194 TaxID=3347069 RepID=UPI003669AF8F